MPSAKIVCIIVTYNGIKWIDKCLISLANSTISPDIVVIDNASNDNTVNHVKENFPAVKLIELKENLGFGKANNIGLIEAIKEDADFLFLLNQDTYVQINCINTLVEASLKNKEFGIISPFHLAYSGNSIEEYFNNYIIGQYAPEYISDLYFRRIKELYQVSFVHAAGWLLPTKTIQTVGGFDPLFYHYGEDNDYVQRTIFKNLKIGFVPEAILYHHGSNTGMSNSGLFSLKRNFAVIQLKTPLASFAGALTMFVKGSFDGVTSAIVSRKRKKFMDEFKLLLSILKISRKISKSRKIQLKDFAYLK